jgi:hypothetical protein
VVVVVVPFLGSWLPGCLAWPVIDAMWWIEGAGSVVCLIWDRSSRFRQSKDIRFDGFLSLEGQAESTGWVIQAKGGGAVSDARCGVVYVVGCRCSRQHQRPLASEEQRGPAQRKQGRMML